MSLHQVGEKGKILFFCPLDGRETMFSDKYEAEKGFGCKGCGYCNFEYPPTKEEWFNS